MHDGVWDKSAKGSHEVRGRTLGIVGYGNIGTQLSVLAEALGMRVYFYDTADKLALGNARRCATLDELLEVADVGHPARRRPAGQRRAVRRGAVRPDAAAQPVPQPLPRHRRRPRGAARATCSAATSPAPRSTCSPIEPKAAGDAFVSSLRGPAQRDPDPARRRLHRGGAGRHRPVRRRQAARLRQRRQHHPVGEPARRCAPIRRGRTRLAHVHHNTPGVLAAVNGMLADHG